MTTALPWTRLGPARFVAPAVLLLLPCLLLWRVVFAGEAFVPAALLRDVLPWRPVSSSGPVPWNPLMWDGIAEFYPWRFFAAQSLQHGWLPLWNPHQFCGTPFVANSQSAVFYPLNLLFVLLPVPAAFGASVLLHLFLTGLVLYGFLRSGLSLRPAAALLGAAVWQLSTWQVAWLALPTFLCVSAWLPAALWLAGRLVERPGAPRAAALGLCLGLMLLAGHLQIGLYCVLLTLAYAGFRAVARIRAGGFPVWRLAGGLAAALGLMLCLVAPQLLPALELSRVSHRASGPASAAGYASYVSLAMPLAHLVTLFLPGFFGDPSQGTYWGFTNYAENACYVGVLALLLALFGIGATWRTRAETRFFAGGALLALLLALGTPLDALLYFGLPGFSQSGSPARVLVLWTFCAAVLAAIGTDALVGADAAHLPKRLGQVVVVWAAGLGLAAGGAVVWITRNAPPGALAAHLGAEADLWRLPAGIGLAGTFAFWLWRRGSFPAPVFGGLLAGLAALDLLGTGIGYNRTAPAAAVYPATPALTYLQEHAGFQRVMPLNRRWSLYAPPPAVLPPNGATVYGLYDTQGYDSLLTGRYMAFASALNGGGSPAPRENGNMVFTDGYGSPQARSAAARWVLSAGPLPADPGLLLRVQDGATYLYENTQALPRVRLAGRMGTAVLEAVTPTRLSVRLAGASPQGALTVADQWYPGWHAWADGREARVTAAPDVFRTVAWAQSAVPAGGPRKVEMRYLPNTFRLGLYALCAALGTVAAAWAACLGRRRAGGTR